MHNLNNFIEVETFLQLTIKNLPAFKNNDLDENTDKIFNNININNNIII